MSILLMQSELVDKLITALIPRALNPTSLDLSLQCRQFIKDCQAKRRLEERFVNRDSSNWGFRRHTSEAFF